MLPLRLAGKPLFEPPGRFLHGAHLAGYDEDQSRVMSIGESRTLKETPSLGP